MTSGTRQVVVVGAGGMGREAAAWVADEPDAPRVHGFIDDRIQAGRSIAGLPVLGGVEWVEEHAADVSVVLAIGAPAARARLTERFRAAGVHLRTSVHPSAVVGPRVDLGVGVLICPNTTLTTDVRVGDTAIVNYGAHVGHDSTVGDHAFLAPATALAGNVTLGVGVQMGIGSSAIPGAKVGDWTVVGAGATVVHSLPAHVTAVGTPARVIEDRRS